MWQARVSSNTSSLGSSKSFVSAIHLIASQTAHSFGLGDCTWEPPEHFENDITKLDEMWESWTRENPGVDPHSLDPRETVLLHEVYVLARDEKKNWPGA